MLIHKIELKTKCGCSQVIHIDFNEPPYKNFLYWRVPILEELASCGEGYSLEPYSKEYIENVELRDFKPTGKRTKIDDYLYWEYKEI